MNFQRGYLRQNSINGRSEGQTQNLHRGITFNDENLLKFIMSDYLLVARSNRSIDDIEE